MASKFWTAPMLASLTITTPALAASAKTFRGSDVYSLDQLCTSALVLWEDVNEAEAVVIGSRDLQEALSLDGLQQ